MGFDLYFFWACLDALGPFCYRNPTSNQEQLKIAL